MSEAAFDLSAARLSDAHDFLGARRFTLSQARARSRQVGVMRFLFIALAVASLSSVFVYTTAYSVAGGFHIEAETIDNQSITMVNPRFTGRVAGDIPFVLNALEAERARDGEGPLTLSGPAYQEITGRVVASPMGVYDPAAGRVELTGGVTFTDSNGNRFTSEAAVIDLDQRVLRGNVRITGDGPLGVVRADAYELHDGEARLVLRGRVRGVLPQQGRRAAPSQTAAIGAPG